MIIKVENEKDYNKFIRKLWLYRLLVFKIFTYKTDSTYKDTKIIVNALNIKSRRKRITYIYDEIIRNIEEFYKGRDLCKFKNSICISHRTCGKMYKCGCCRKCIYNEFGKCLTKNIACKMFYCSIAEGDNKVLSYGDVKLLYLLSPLSRIIIKSDYFSLREDIINDVYLGFLIAPFRIIYRNIKNSIKLKNKKLLVTKK